MHPRRFGSPPPCGDGRPQGACLAASANDDWINHQGIVSLFVSSTCMKKNIVKNNKDNDNDNHKQQYTLTI